MSLRATKLSCGSSAMKTPFYMIITNNQ
uniref:Uncharacterized protein n=1 Tax=Tetranychus urticae TaxID=32264 RepID=T1K6H7_TETUR